MLAASRNRRDAVHPRPAPRCASRWRRPRVVRDAEWIAVLCLLAGGGLLRGRPGRGRTVPAFVLAGVAWPLAGLRGLPWLGRSLRPVTGLGTQRGALRTAVLSLLAVLVFGAALRLGGRAVRRVGRRRRTRPRVDTLRAARVRARSSSAAWCSPAATSRSTRPRSSPSRGPPRPVAHRFEWLVAGAGRRRRLRALPGRAGHGDLRRARLPRAHDRPDLRGVRPPGLRPAHRRDRAHPARRVGGDPQGAAGDAPRTGAWLRGVARPAVRCDAGGRRVRALPDERLPGGLRLHPAAAAGRRVRGLARPAGARA